MATLLARRLTARGYTLQQLLPLFTDTEAHLEAMEKAARQPTQIKPTPETQLPIIFHLKYHPQGIQRERVQSVYAKTMAPILKTERKIIIAVSRPKNL